MTDTDQLSDWNRRLKARAERLVQAVEALPVPVTADDIARQARTIAAVQRAINLLFRVTTPRTVKAAAAMETRLESLTTALDADLPPMNRQQRRMAERMLKKRG